VGRACPEAAHAGPAPEQLPAGIQPRAIQGTLSLAENKGGKCFLKKNNQANLEEQHEK